MNTSLLESTAHLLVAPGRGILAADESAGTCEKRFAAVGIESSEENRRQYREILVTAPATKTALSGIIFYEETFWQKTNGGVLFTDSLVQRGILPGIKLDLGLQDLQGFLGEKTSVGLDTLVQRIEPFVKAGAMFAKWRSVISIGAEMPSSACIEANCFILARYARICQDFGLVPIVEPEVLFDGSHTLDRCAEVMRIVYDCLFATMDKYRVYFPGAILKTSMVLPGRDSGIPIDHDAVARATVQTLHNHVPWNLGGVVFLSGGQTPTDAFINLNRIAKIGGLPFGVTFSFSRGIQDQVIKTWAKNPGNPAEAEAVYTKMLALAVAARDGHLDEMSHLGDFVSHSQDL